MRPQQLHSFVTAFFFAFALSSSTLVGVARADDPPPPALVPPALLTPLAPPYPSSAEGDASVLLEVVVAADGSVREVRVVEGVAPFAPLAVESMQAARFSPAMRGDRAVAATVRFRVDFTKPPPPEPPPPCAPDDPTCEPDSAAGADGPPSDGAGSSAPSPAAAATTGVAPAGPAPASSAASARDDAPIDVRVRGGRSHTTGTAAESLGRAEVRALPGAFGDPFRAIEASAGLAPVITGLPYFYIRGAPPGNVGYFYDGVRVPYLFHFGLGPSVIHSSLIARTDLYKGGYPAAFGRYAGGIVDATAMPDADGLHAEGQLRAIDAGAFVTAPLAKGKGAALVAGRWSYTAALFTLLSSDTSLDYRDYQARVSYPLGEHDTISLLTFGAYDLASQRDRIEVDGTTSAIIGTVDGVREVERVLFASEFHRLDARWDHSFRGGAHSRLAATLGYDRTRVESRRAAEDRLTGGRFDLVVPLGPRAVIRGGADVMIDRYEADALARYSDDDDVVARQQDLFADRVDFAGGARVDAVLAPVPAVEVTPGIRIDVFGSAGVRAVGIDPRLAGRFFVSDKIRILHAYGLATQAPSTPVALPAIAVARLAGGLQRSLQTSAAVEADLPLAMTATAGVFHNAFYDLNDALGTAQVELVDLERSDALLGKSRGSAYGLELGLRRRFTQRIAGIVSYTVSRSMRTAEGERFVSAYDRPHVFSAASSFDLGKGYRLGGRFVAYSGIPMRPARPEFAGQVVAVPPERTPSFVRVDLRFEKRWTVGKSGYLTFVVEALNATLSREVNGYRCGTSLAVAGAPTPICVQRIVGPVSVPSIGLEGGF